MFMIIMLIYFALLWIISVDVNFILQRDAMQCNAYIIFSGEMPFEVKGYCFYSNECESMCVVVSVYIQHHQHYTTSMVSGWYGKALSCWYFKYSLYLPFTLKVVCTSLALFECICIDDTLFAFNSNYFHCLVYVSFPYAITLCNDNNANVR